MTQSSTPRTKWQTIRDSLAYDVIRSAPGGWGRSEQAWRQLVDHVGSDDAATKAVEHMMAKHPSDVHPDRRQ